MPAVPWYRTAVGARRLVALTCSVCGQLRDGDQYERRPRSTGPAYLDRRCRACRWARMAANPGR